MFSQKLHTVRQKKSYRYLNPDTTMYVAPSSIKQKTKKYLSLSSLILPVSRIFVKNIIKIPNEIFF